MVAQTSASQFSRTKSVSRWDTGSTKSTDGGTQFLNLFDGQEMPVT